MLPILVLIYTTLSYIYIESVSVTILSNWSADRSYVAREALKDQSQAVQSFRRRTYAYPVDIATLSGVSGYAHLRQYLDDDWMSYRTSGMHNDGYWRYSRAISVVQPTRFISWPDYWGVENNRCGVAESTSQSWCGVKGLWYNEETKDFIAQEIINQRKSLRRLMRRFAEVYNSEGAFPDGGVIAVGESHSLSDLTSTSSTSVNCSAGESWAEITLGCEDLFSIWGGEVILNYISPQHIALVVKSPYSNSAGAIVYVSEEVRL